MNPRLLSIIIACTAAAPALSHAQSPDRRPVTPPQVVDPFEREIRRPEPSKDAEREEKTGKIDLRPRFEKGQVNKFRMELDQKSKTLIPALEEEPTESTSKQELGLVFKVQEVTDDETVIDLSFSNVKMTKKTDEGTETFDSSQSPTKDKDSELAPSLRALAKTSFTLHLDKDGNVTRIDGGDALMALESFGSPGGSSPGGLPALSGGATGAGFKDALGSIFNVKKGSGLVSVGEEWGNTDTLDTGLLGKFTISNKHKLKSHNGSEAKISFMGHIEPDSASDSLSLVKISDSSFVGDYTWNTREGMLRRMTMNQHVVLEPSAAGGVKVTSDMKTTVTRGG
jgi:hypothetical protein